jgi:hypothetical protein
MTPEEFSRLGQSAESVFLRPHKERLKADCGTCQGFSDGAPDNSAPLTEPALCLEIAVMRAKKNVNSTSD